MQKLHHSITIDAPREHVYKVMLEKPTYDEWTKVFLPDPSSDASFEGSWEQGSEIKFVDGEGNGMLATVAENRPGEFLSLKHHAMVEKGTETKIDPPAYENYTFTDEDGTTTLDVEVDMDEQYAEMMDEMWPKALNKLKEIAESSK